MDNFIVEVESSEKKKSGLIECEIFPLCVKNPKYEFNLSWYSNRKNIYKLTLKKVRELKELIPSLRSEENGIIIFTSRKINPLMNENNKRKYSNITQLPLSVDLFNILTSKKLILSIENIVNEMEQEYEKIRQESGQKGFLEKKIKIMENENVSFCLKIIISTFMKAISSKKREFTHSNANDENDDIYITLRYEPVLDIEEKSFFYNFISLPAEKMINYLKKQNFADRINSELKNIKNYSDKEHPPLKRIKI